MTLVRGQLVDLKVYRRGRSKYCSIYLIYLVLEIHILIFMNI